MLKVSPGATKKGPSIELSARLVYFVPLYVLVFFPLAAFEIFLFNVGIQQFDYDVPFLKKCLYGLGFAELLGCVQL